MEKKREETKKRRGCVGRSRREEGNWKDRRRVDVGQKARRVRRREGKKGHEKRKEGKWEAEKKLGTKGRGKAGRGEEMRRRRSGEEII